MILNLDVGTRPANQNFISVLKGIAGQTYKGWRFYFNGDELCFYSPDYPGAVILPSKKEERSVAIWNVKKGHIYQQSPNHDQYFSYFSVKLNNENETTTHPKLGSVQNNLNFRTPHTEYRFIDCGIITE